jgi:hypothetical protein
MHCAALAHPCAGAQQEQASKDPNASTLHTSAVVVSCAVRAGFFHWSSGLRAAGAAAEAEVTEVPLAPEPEPESRFALAPNDYVKKETQATGRQRAHPPPRSTRPTAAAAPAPRARRGGGIPAERQRQPAARAVRSPYRLGEARLLARRRAGGRGAPQARPTSRRTAHCAPPKPKRKRWRLGGRVGDAPRAPPRATTTTRRPTTPQIGHSPPRHPPIPTSGRFHILTHTLALQFASSRLLSSPRRSKYSSSYSPDGALWSLCSGSAWSRFRWAGQPTGSHCRRAGSRLSSPAAPFW